jgi:hypothetical protein
MQTCLMVVSQTDRKRPMVAPLLALLVAAAPLSESAELRSCGPPPSIEAEFEASSVVVIRRVVAIATTMREWPEPDVTGERLKFQMRVATLDVEQRWKGPVEKTIQVETCELCTTGVGFAIGERWVVFAQGVPPTTGDCGRTLLYSDPRYPSAVEWLETKAAKPLANLQMQPTRRVSLAGARLILGSLDGSRTSSGLTDRSEQT